jgi:DNA primase
MRYDADRIKALNPLSRELDRYGITLDRKGFARCPFHGEKTASFRAYPDGTFHCFGCHAYGDVITFVMKMEGLSFGEACKRLDRDITYAEQRKIDRARRERENQQSERERAQAEYWHVFDAWKDNEDNIQLFSPREKEEPSNLFLYFIARRESLTYLLDCAEIQLCKAVMN